MRKVVGLAVISIALIVSITASAASKPHVVLLGKPQTVKIFFGHDESQSLSISVRPLYVDAKLKQYTTGEAHDVTDRQFVVQRVYRLNDSLPNDPPKQSSWIWQRGDWLLVDRVSGHIAQVKLPDFDTANSHVTWYRDYAAYCGISENGVRWNAIVAQLGVRKALFRKELMKLAADKEVTSADCPPMSWERHPARVTFSPSGGQPFTVNVVPHHAEEIVADNDDEE